MAQASVGIRQAVAPEPAGDNDRADIRAQIGVTRARLTVQLTALRERVRGTVAAAQASVTQTVQAVKGGFRDTWHAVHDAFDLTSHVKRRPWLMVGTALFVGYALGCVSRPKSPGRAVVPATNNGADVASRSRLIREHGSAPRGPAAVRQPTYPVPGAERQSTLLAPCRTVNEDRIDQLRNRGCPTEG